MCPLRSKVSNPLRGVKVTPNYKRASNSFYRHYSRTCGDYLAKYQTGVGVVFPGQSDWISKSFGQKIDFFLGVRLEPATKKINFFRKVIFD